MTHRPGMAVCYWPGNLYNAASRLGGAIITDSPNTHFGWNGFISTFEACRLDDVGSASFLTISQRTSFSGYRALVSALRRVPAAATLARETVAGREQLSIAHT